MSADLKVGLYKSKEEMQADLKVGLYESEKRNSERCVCRVGITLRRASGVID
jgi:hypothetical protein